MGETRMTDYLRVAEGLAREAGALLREGYGTALQVDYKGAIDLVTDYDRRSEALILAGLRAAFPGHGILGEESGRSLGDDYEWLVDPLDGTTNFAHAYPMFAVSLALTQRGRLVAGVVYDPLRDELFAAEAGAGATLNGQRLRVSSVADLGRALINTGFGYDVHTNPRNNVAEFTAFLMRAQAVRRAGSAALDCAYVGAGRAEGYWELGSKPWDLGAGVLVTLEAGGRVSTADGDPNFLGQPSVVVSNGHLHEAMLTVLRDAGLPRG
jgi:myo-inositol-1(or 4)-monophosphatase